MDLYKLIVGKYQNILIYFSKNIFIRIPFKFSFDKSERPAEREESSTDEEISGAETPEVREETGLPGSPSGRHAGFRHEYAARGFQRSACPSGDCFRL